MDRPMSAAVTALVSAGFFFVIRNISVALESQRESICYHGEISANSCPARTR